MTIKECIDIVDNLKPNQYSPKEKVMWLSFIDEIIINDVLKTHEGYDGKYDNFAGYSEDKLSVQLIVASPYDRLYTAYLKMKIDGENGETARYNNSASLFNSYLMEFRKHYNKTHMPLDMTSKKPMPKQCNSASISDAMFESLKRELYYLLSEDFAEMTSRDKLYDIVTSYAINNVQMLKGKDGRDGIDGKDGKDGRDGVDGKDGVDATSSMITTDGTIVSPNADFAEVAEWADGNPNNEDRTGYFVCANVPVEGIVMKKATSIDDVKGVTILAPAFAGNYSKDKVDSNGNLLPKYSYVAIIGFVPVRDNGTCTVGGRCMPDNNGCAIPSSNSMGYQVVNRIDENRVLIIIEPNGDMVQRVKTKINELQESVAELQSKSPSANLKWHHLATQTFENEAQLFLSDKYGEDVGIKGVFIKTFIPQVDTTKNFYLKLLDTKQATQIQINAMNFTSTTEGIYGQIMLELDKGIWQGWWSDGANKDNYGWSKRYSLAPSQVVRTETDLPFVFRISAGVGNGLTLPAGTIIEVWVLKNG